MVLLTSQAFSPLLAVKAEVPRKRSRSILCLDCIWGCFGLSDCLWCYLILIGVGGCPPLSFLKVANRRMIKKKYIYWQDDDMWLGYLEEYPDYWTQGETEEELRENLLDIYNELTSGTIQNIRRVAELEVS